MYCFVQLLAATVAVEGPLSLPAEVKDDLMGLPPVAYDGLCALLVVVAALMAVYFARGAFDTPILTLDDVPAPPRYMTQRRQYRLGMIAYIGLCLIGYILIVAFYRQLSPFFAPFEPEPLRKLVQTYVQESQLSFPVVVVLGAAALVTLLKIEHEWNPFYVLRRVVRAWVCIPELANHIMEAARHNLTVPPDERKIVASDPTKLVDIGDFDKDRQSLDRIWAEICYLRLWLNRNRDVGLHLTFFNEPSFAWSTLETNFAKMHAQIVPLKQAQKSIAFGPEFFEDTAARADRLRRQYCRLAACFIVFKNETKRAAIRDATQFGARVASLEVRTNPMRHALVFLVAIVVSINLGVWLSSALWDLANPAAAAAAISASTEDANLATLWIYFGLAAYGAPIVVVLLLRYLGWVYDPEQPSSYLNSYAAIFVIALCVSVAALALAAEFGPGAAAGKPILGLLYADFKWGWAPALICLYVVYHVDRHIDPLLPDVGMLGSEGIPQRLVSCLLFAIIVMVVAALPTRSLSVSSGSAWPVEKLHAVVVGTIFTIAFVVALVSQFGFGKRSSGALASARLANPMVHAP
jgi:hypothetical protein